jgi:hypothetical protein
LKNAPRGEHRLGVADDNYHRPDVTGLFAILAVIPPAELPVSGKDFDDSDLAFGRFVGSGRSMASR